MPEAIPALDTKILAAVEVLEDAISVYISVA